jgi:hypothetical protein
LRSRGIGQRNHRSRPGNFVVVARVAVVVHQQREHARAREIGAQEFRRVTVAHQAALGHEPVVGPHFERDRAQAAANGIVETHPGFETQRITLEIDDELADGTCADTARVFLAADPDRLIADGLAGARGAAALRHLLEADALHPYFSRRRRFRGGRAGTGGTQRGGADCQRDAARRVGKRGLMWTCGLTASAHTIL